MFNLMVRQLMGESPILLVEELHRALRPLVPRVLIHTVPKSQPL